MYAIRIAAVALVLLGCRQNPTLVVPPSFERPGAVAFFCYDTETRAAVSLDQCNGLDGVTTETKALTALVAQTARGEIASVDLRLDRVIDADLRVPGFTFVQVGEVPSGIVVPPNQPSVTYIASFGSRRIEYYPTSDFREDIDAVGSSGRGSVPLPDGPVDLVLSSAGDVLFAALPEEGSIAVLPIQADLSLANDITILPLALPDPLPLRVVPATSAMCRMPEDACEGVTTCDTEGATCSGDDLVICAPDAFGCLVETTTDCTERAGGTCDGSTRACTFTSDPCEGITQCAAEGIACDGSDLVTCDADGFGCLIETRVECTMMDGGVCDPGILAYQKACPTTLELRAPRVGEDESLAVDPLATLEPRRLFVDGNVLLVTDANVPVIHRFAVSGSTLTPLDPLMPGARIRELALTPVVPATPTGDPASEPARYLYAIDADEGSVLVMDYLEASPTFGAVLPVHVGEGRWDRIRLAERARSLDVMTPGYPGVAVCNPESIDEERGENVSPATLQGVFLAVGMANGLVEVVDVHDLNLPCRGGNASCSMPIDERDERVFIRRHAARIGSFVTAASAVIGTPTFAFEGAPGRLETNGIAGGGGPGLAPVDACPTYLDPIFPSDAVEGSPDGFDPLICSVVEPWSARSERWDTTWEGAIPGAVSGVAHLEMGRIRIEGHRLCARGVLGRDDISASMVTAEDPESLYAGDQVFITTDPPPLEDGGFPFDCERFVADEDGVRDEVGLLIVSAFQDALIVEDPDGVLQCYRTELGNVLFGIEVRVNDAFAVRGAISGFVHRVVPNEEGACRVDRAGQPWVADEPATHLNGRAFNEVPYENPYVAFTINNAAGLRTETAILTFSVGSVPPALVVDVGLRGRGRLATIVDGVRYSETDQRLYVIDSNADSFVQYELDPFQREQTFE